MVKHRSRETMKSLFGSYVDPEKEEQLQEAKTDIEDKVKKILKLIKNDNIEEDDTPDELLKRESLAELIEDFHNQYQLLYSRYDHLTGELKKRITDKQGKGSSSSDSDSDSDSDYSSKNKDSKNGEPQNEFQKIIDGLKQELEVVHKEVADLNRKLTITHEEKEDINSKYQAALSKIQEADKNNMDLKTDAEALGIQSSKLLAENTELNKQLDIAGKVEAELSQKLEDMKIENNSLAVEKEAALHQIDEEKKITDDLRNLVDQLKDEKSVNAKESEAVTDELSILKQQLKHAEQQITTISHNLEVKKEENESLKAKLSQASNEVQLSQNRIQEFVSESSQLKEKLDEREREVSTLTQMREEHQHESSNLTRELEAQITNLGLELESLQNQNKQMEEQNLGLRHQISELDMKYKEREEELSAIMKKLKHNENESSSKISDLTSQINNLQGDIGSYTNEVNGLQQELGHLKPKHAALLAMHADRTRENSELEIQIQSLKKEQEKHADDNVNSSMQIRNLELEISTLKNKNSGDEEQIRANIQEISHLTQQKLELHDRIAELEKISAERESEFSVVEDKLIRADIEGSTQILAFSGQVKNLQHDLVSLQNAAQKSAQQRKKLELELDSTRKRKSVAEEQLRAKDHELNTLKQRANEDKKQIDAHWAEIAKLAEEILDLETEVDTLKRRLATREFEFSVVQDKLYKAEKEASGKIIAFTAQVDNLQKDLLSLQKTKEELELHCQKIKEEHEEILTTVVNENNELTIKNTDLHRTLEEREDAYQKLNEEYKQIDSWLNECKVELEVAKRKIEKMEVEFRESIESKDKMVADLECQLEDAELGIDNNLEKVRNLEVELRLTGQRLRVTEQLLNEREQSLTNAEARFQQDQRALEDRIATLSAKITADEEAFHETVTKIEVSVNSVISGIDTVSKKFSEDFKNHENCISNISHELQVAKECVREMNMEKGQLKIDKNLLLEELQGKKEEELALRENIENLEAKAITEESEKMNVTATVVQLKKTVEELENLMKQKEENMLDLGEQKREVIRQLCFWIDYHRERNDYLKEIISKTRRGQRAA